MAATPHFGAQTAAGDVNIFEQASEDFLTAKALSFVVLGASGDLAKKKTFPSLYSLFLNKLLPPHTRIFGYARSKLSHADLHALMTPFCKKMGGTDETLQTFLSMCLYVAGAYDSREDFAKLNEAMVEVEKDNGGPAANRVFYLALPPSVFVSASSALQPECMSSSGWNRVIVEKPFGHDSESSKELVAALAQIYPEEMQYRIDHYLGKEMVENVLAMRFSNLAFQPLWNRQSIQCVQITFKEDFGTQGRGGYFDGIGIIRDVMQNHLLQVLALIAMERPVSLSAEHVRDEKVKVLRCISPISMDDVVLGQYVAANGNEGYLDDPTVPKDSKCPTFAAAVLRINNDRWADVPFILKCGKALNERKAEVRIQLRDVPGQLFPGCARNEIVIRIQPNEAMYMKIMAKQPGLGTQLSQTELDLSYNTRYSNVKIADAYEKLIYNVLRGDRSQFVRADELEAAWSIFTPMLHTIEREKPQPIPYAYGSRGPKQAIELAEKEGYIYFEGYQWGADKPKL